MLLSGGFSRHDVEAVEDVQGLGNLLRDHVEVRLPHVAAYE